VSDDRVTRLSGDYLTQRAKTQWSPRFTRRVQRFPALRPRPTRALKQIVLAVAAHDGLPGSSFPLLPLRNRAYNLARSQFSDGGKMSRYEKFMLRPRQNVKRSNHHLKTIPGHAPLATRKLLTNKTMRTFKAAAIHSVCASLLVCAGVTFTATAAEESTPAEKPAYPDYYPWTVGIGGGSEGLFGGFAQWHFSDNVGVRVGGGWTQWSMNESVAGINYDLKVTLAGEPISFLVFPWKKNSFHFAFGWLFNQNEVKGTANSTGTIIINGQPFPTPNVGTLTMKAQQQPINPYIGIGGNFLYFDRAHQWALGGELGIIYTGDVKISIDRSGPPNAVIDAAVKGAEGRLEKWAEQWQWLPLVTLKLSYSF